MENENVINEEIENREVEEQVDGNKESENGLAPAVVGVGIGLAIYGAVMLVTNVIVPGVREIATAVAEKRKAKKESKLKVCPSEAEDKKIYEPNEVV